MMNTQKSNDDVTAEQSKLSIDKVKPPTVDENFGFYISSGLKIVDKDTEEVLLQIRGD